MLLLPFDFLCLVVVDSRLLRIRSFFSHFVFTVDAVKPVNPYYLNNLSNWWNIHSNLPWVDRKICSARLSFDWMWKIFLWPDSVCLEFSLSHFHSACKRRNQWKLFVICYDVLHKNCVIGANTWCGLKLNTGFIFMNWYFVFCLHAFHCTYDRDTFIFMWHSLQNEPNRMIYMEKIFFYYIAAATKMK